MQVFLFQFKSGICLADLRGQQLFLRSDASDHLVLKILDDLDIWVFCLKAC